MALSCTVFEIFDFEKYRELDIRVRGKTRSSKLVPFDSLACLLFPMENFYSPEENW